MESLEELLRVRPARLGEQHLAAEAAAGARELVGVALLVEEVGAEDEIPRRGAQQRLRLAPANARDAKEAPFRSALRRSSSIASSAQSVARTSAPRSAAASDGSPSPQPSSSTRGPRRSRVATCRASARPLGQSSAQYGRNSSSSNVASSMSSSALGGRRIDSRSPSAELDVLLDEVQSAANRSTGDAVGIAELRVALTPERVPRLLLAVEPRGDDAGVDLVDLGRAAALEGERELVAGRASSRVGSCRSRSSVSNIRRRPLGIVASTWSSPCGELDPEQA